MFLRKNNSNELELHHSVKDFLTRLHKNKINPNQLTSDEFQIVVNCCQLYNEHYQKMEDAYKFNVELLCQLEANITKIQTLLQLTEFEVDLKRIRAHLEDAIKEFSRPDLMPVLNELEAINHGVDLGLHSVTKKNINLAKIQHIKDMILFKIPSLDPHLDIGNDPIELIARRLDIITDKLAEFKNTVTSASSSKTISESKKTTASTSKQSSPLHQATTAPESAASPASAPAPTGRAQPRSQSSPNPSSQESTRLFVRRKNYTDDDQAKLEPRKKSILDIFKPK